jgi:hypothetical protein
MRMKKKKKKNKQKQRRWGHNSRLLQSPRNQIDIKTAEVEIVKPSRFYVIGLFIQVLYSISLLTAQRR